MSMAMSVAKQVRQIRILGALMVVIVAAIGYLFRDRFLPAPLAGEEFAVQKRTLNLPKSLPEQIYSRQDFEALHEFGEVPVQSIPAPPSDPFAPLPLPAP